MKWSKFFEISCHKIYGVVALGILNLMINWWSFILEHDKTIGWFALNRSRCKECTIYGLEIG